MLPINPAIIVVILNPSLCHPEGSEGSRSSAQDRLRVLLRGSAETERLSQQHEKARFFALLRMTSFNVLSCRVNKTGS
jgi:hypothetical protein